MKMKKNNNLITLKETAKFLKKNNNYCVLCHASPDGDTLGAAAALVIALKKMGKNAFIVCPDEIPEKYSYFLSKDLLKKGEFSVVLAVDVADMQLLGGLKDEFLGKVDLCIDHHISNTKYAKMLYLDANASATCESIYELLKLLKVELNEVMASALYTGISTDTGSFKYSNVTAKTHKIAAELYGYNINAPKIAKLMFDTKSKRILALEKAAMNGAEFHFNDRCFVMAVTEDMLNKTGCKDNELEGLAAITRSIEGVLVGITIKQRGENEYRISLRTETEIDASRICAALGGGGHKAAAGCTLRGSLSEVKEQLLKQVQIALEEKDAGISTNR